MLNLIYASNLVDVNQSKIEIQGCFVSFYLCITSRPCEAISARIALYMVGIDEEVAWVSCSV